MKLISVESHEKLTKIVLIMIASGVVITGFPYQSSGKIIQNPPLQPSTGRPEKKKLLSEIIKLPKKSDMPSYKLFLNSYLTEITKSVQEKDVTPYDGTLNIQGNFKFLSPFGISAENLALRLDFVEFLESERDTFLKSGVGKVEFEYAFLHALFVAIKDSDYFTDLAERTGRLRKKYENKLVHIEGGDSGWFVKLDEFRNLSKKAGKSSIGEQILGESVMFPVGGECEGDRSCVLSRYVTKIAPYLINYPTGQYSGKYLNYLVELVDSSDQGNDALKRIILALPTKQAEVLKKSMLRPHQAESEE